jgi:hypothetical protein
VTALTTHQWQQHEEDKPRHDVQIGADRPEEMARWRPGFFLPVRVLSFSRESASFCASSNPVEGGGRDF